MHLLFLPIHFAMACGLMWLVNHIGLGSWRKSSQAHWTEQARLLWPVRIAAALNMFLIPVILLLAQELIAPGPQHLVYVNATAAFWGTMVGGYPLARNIFPAYAFTVWLREAVLGWSLKAAFFVALVLAGVLMPAQPGWPMAMVVVLYAAFHLSLQWGLLLAIVRRVRFVHAPGERLQRIVVAQSALTGMSAPVSWEMDGQIANAFALPLTRELVVSRRLLEICDDAELGAVCAHELAHLAESRMVRAGRLLGSFQFFPLIFIQPLSHLGHGLGVILAFVGMWLVGMFSRKLSRRMEVRADAEATRCQADEGVYARALEKLHQANLLPAVNVNNRQSHPHLYDRLTAAGITPGYHRPKGPAKTTPLQIGIYLVLGVLIALLARRS